MSFLLLLSLAASPSVDVGGGVVLAAGPVAGTGNITFAGPGLVATIRAGDEVQAAIQVGASVPIVAASPVEPPQLVPPTFFGPMASASLGASWRFFGSDDVAAGFGGGLFGAVVPWTCGDCFGAALVGGVAPHVFVSWHVADRLWLAAGAEVPFGFTHEGQPFAGALVTVEPIFRLDMKD